MTAKAGRAADAFGALLIAIRTKRTGEELDRLYGEFALALKEVYEQG